MLRNYIFLFGGRKNLSYVFSLFYSAKPFREEAEEVEYLWTRNFSYYYLLPTSLLGGLKPLLVFLTRPLSQPHTLCRHIHFISRKLIPHPFKAHLPPMLYSTGRRRHQNWYRICHRRPSYTAPNEKIVVFSTFFFFFFLTSISRIR